MIGRLGFLALLSLAACQQPIRESTPKVPPPVGPEIVVLVSATGQPARDLMHELAARCWLDGVVRGAQLIVKPDGNLIIVGDTRDLLAADYIGLKGPRSRWRLSGEAIRDERTARRLVQTLDEAVLTGNTTCPRTV